MSEIERDELDLALDAVEAEHAAFDLVGDVDGRLRHGGRHG